MQRLTEFLNSINEQQDLYILYEDLGTLKVIAPKFLKGILSSSKSKLRMVKKPDGTFVKKSGSVRALNPKLGDNSPVVIKNLKSASDALNTLENEADKIALVITDADYDEQVIVVTKTYNTDTRDTPSFRVGIDIEALLRGLEADIAMEVKKKLSDANISVSDKILFYADSNHARTYKILVAVAKAINAKRLPAQIQVLGIDTDRQKVHADRMASRIGVIPVIGKDDMKHFENSAKRALADRLQKFKMSKASGVKSIEDLVDLVLHEGYLEKIRINSFPYYMSGDHIRIDNLKSGKEAYRSYVDYSLEDKSEEILALRKSERELDKAAFDSGTEYAKELESRQKTFPPRVIRIYLALKGGAIVPGEAVVQQRYY